MAEPFIPLRDFVLPPAEAGIDVVESFVAPPIEQTEAPARDASADVRRFRAAVRDAVDVAVRTLLCDIAAEVLARELELAPAILERIVARACARHASEGLVGVRVHPGEAALLADASVNVIADSDLRRGDVLLEVRCGTIDATLGARLADVLDGVAP